MKRKDCSHSILVTFTIKQCRSCIGWLITSHCTAHAHPFGANERLGLQAWPKFGARSFVMVVHPVCCTVSCWRTWMEAVLNIDCLGSEKRSLLVFELCCCVWGGGMLLLKRSYRDSTVYWRWSVTVLVAPDVVSYVRTYLWPGNLLPLFNKIIFLCVSG